MKLAFGVGQAAEGLFCAAYGTFLIFYCSQVLGLPGSLAGAAVGIAHLVDAFTDVQICAGSGRKTPASGKNSRHSVPSSASPENSSKPGFRPA